MIRILLILKLVENVAGIWTPPRGEKCNLLIYFYVYFNATLELLTKEKLYIAYFL